jgi:hypothetical protein
VFGTMWQTFGYNYMLDKRVSTHVLGYFPMGQVLVNERSGGPLADIVTKGQVRTFGWSPSVYSH